MEDLLAEIEEAIEARLYYLALMGALTLPDIAAALQSENGMTRGEDYKAWLKANFDWREWPDLSAEDIYGARCALLHQFSPHQRRPLGFHRIVFVPPIGGQNPGRVVRRKSTDAQSPASGDKPAKPFEFYTADHTDFVYDLVEAARSWWDANQNSPVVAENRQRLFGRKSPEFLPELELPARGYFLG